MNRFIVLAVLVAGVAAEAPGGYGGGGSPIGSSGGIRGSSSFGGSSGGAINEYVDEALLARVAEVLASGGSNLGQDNEASQYVDASIFSRVASSLGAGGNNGGNPTQYGPPQQGGSLGNPEPAQRIAEWDLSETRDSNTNQGGYPGAVPPAASAPAPSGGYGAPASRGFGGSSSSGGAIRLGRPEVAQQVDAFELSSGGQGGAARGSSGSSQGYSQGGYN